MDKYNGIWPKQPANGFVLEKEILPMQPAGAEQTPFQT